MSPSRRLPMQQGRYATLRQRKVTAFDCFLFGGAMVILAVCGIFLTLHFLSQGVHGNEPGVKYDLNSGRNPQTERLESGQCPSGCYTKECLRTAAEVLEMLDPTADPCEDFSLFACGGYKRIPTEHDAKLVYLWSTEEEAIKVFRELIQETPKSVPENIVGSSLSKLRTFYDSCLDIKASEENAIPTALKYLEYFGIKSWPELNSDFTFSNPDLDEVLISMAFYKQEPFFRLDVAYTFLLNIEDWDGVRNGYKGDRGLKIQMYSQNRPIFHEEGKVKEDKMALIKAILEYTVPNSTLSNEILEDVFAFDLTFDAIMKNASQSRHQCGGNRTGDCVTDLSYNCREGVNQEMDRWCKIATEILDRSGFSKKNSPIPVLLEDQGYFRELGLLIERTSQRTIAHVLALQFFMENAFFMNSDLSRKTTLPEEDLDFISKKYLNEIPEIGRTQFCTALACYRLPKLAEAAFYVGKSNNTELRKEVNEIFSYVKEESLSAASEMTWIDADIKRILEDLLSNTYFVPEKYFSFVSDLSKIDELHQELQLSEETFLANVLESRKLSNTLYFLSLDDLEERNLYYSIPFQFHPLLEDSFPAVGMQQGNLVFPVFTTHRPRYANFASLGFVIGHEIGHAIGLELYGPFHQNKSQAYRNALEEKQECLENHFGEYEVYSTGVKVRGNVTFQENLADYFAIRNAFKSFKKYQETHGIDEMLPGLHYSNEQMFFILSAQIWCATHTPEAIAAYFQEGHSPSNVRILGPNKNFHAFSEAFKCALGSPMNPISKCQI